MNTASSIYNLFSFFLVNQSSVAQTPAGKITKLIFATLL
jgi:hypothetical protein